MNKNNTKRGFVNIIGLAIIIFILLAYFKVDLHVLVNNPLAQQIILIGKQIWANFLLPMINFIKSSIPGLVDAAHQTASSTAPVVGK